MKPIAQHNAELAEHMDSLFPADPGKRPRVLFWSQERECWLLTPTAFPEPRRGWLNYDGKIEIVKKKESEATFVIKRRDMSDAEVSRLQVIP